MCCAGLLAGCHIPAAASGLHAFGLGHLPCHTGPGSNSHLSQVISSMSIKCKPVGARTAAGDYPQLPETLNVIRQGRSCSPAAIKYQTLTLLGSWKETCSANPDYWPGLPFLASRT